MTHEEPDHSRFDFYQVRDSKGILLTLTLSKSLTDEHSTVIRERFSHFLSEFNLNRNTSTEEAIVKFLLTPPEEE